MAVSRKNSSTIYSEHPTSKNSSHYYQKKKEKKDPRNAVIINFSQGEKVTVEDVKRELAKYGSVRSVQLCTMDSCQAFVTFQKSSEFSARKIVSKLLKLTSGILFVKQFIWTICRPEEWKKCMEHPAESTNLAGKGVTVDELNSIFTNFVQHNSSMSQTSIFSDSTQSFSSFSSLSLSRSYSSSSSPNADSCDSSVTITPFSFYPAQSTSGFINLPPPYHTLPDTAFFRRTRIIPPPSIQPISITQTIMDCYIKSIQKGDSQFHRRRPLSIGSRMDLECNWAISF
ncbi:hypothetical protein GCK72_017601 [Caenorhabditis remanei]|uniref:Uncharacterized protein n=1 Tax=Caenorhabditis remanei TaxID=31234 RepID=A0A6A5G948_CAERE|nr:hypothetical protein GCK72_017601 [Caenorhabditis remanei]KAF1751049.1 hypothetical protein GCK72_017601 [Caenorhabditis remanei]